MERQTGLKTVLCMLNAKYIHSGLAPYYLKAAAQENCAYDHCITIVEGTINRPANVLGRLMEEEYDVYGFSCYIWNIERVLELIKEVKARRPHCTVLLGGPEVSYRAEDVLNEYPFVDAVISGEGEVPFAHLLDALASGGLLSAGGAAGLSCRVRDGSVVTTPPGAADFVPPSPYLTEYPMGLQGRMAYVESSRGCPFACSFCLSGRHESVRFFPLDRAKADLVLAANSGAKTVKLIDRTFNCNPKRAQEIWAFLLCAYENGTIPKDVRFHFEIGADLLTKENLAFLRTVPKGMFQFEAGIQSLQPNTLSAVCRKTDVGVLKENLRSIMELGSIHLHVDLIAGLPFEGMAEFADSFNGTFALRPHALQLGFLKLLYGTELRNTAEGWGCVYRKDAPYEVISTHAMGAEDLQRLHLLEDALERLYNSNRFLNTVEYLLKAHGKGAFELFDYIGSKVQAQAGVDLFCYTEQLYTTLIKEDWVEPMALRDVLLMDLYASIRRPKLPQCLRVMDDRLSSLRMAARKNGAGDAAILYHGRERVLYVDYAKKDAITGRYSISMKKIIDGESRGE
ncbi:MAG: DUF4080 domain-containing protein [Clostridiales bacterium]|nr:DUF4080 domain-containing protein [Clostridiales bacterium]